MNEQKMVEATASLIAKLEDDGTVTFYLSEYGYHRDGNTSLVAKRETYVVPVPESFNEHEFKCKVINNLVAEKAKVLADAEEKAAKIDAKLLELAMLGYDIPDKAPVEEEEIDPWMEYERKANFDGDADDADFDDLGMGN